MDFSFPSVSKNFILPLGINATAGSLVGIMLYGGKYAKIATVSGAISGLLQAKANGSRPEKFKKLDDMFSNKFARVAARSFYLLFIYAVHVPVLMGTSKFIFKTDLSIGKALVLTTLGGGVAMIEYLAAQSIVDAVKSGEDVSFF